MAAFTTEDVIASSKFAESNNNLRLLKKLIEKAPHLATWLDVEVRDATHDDYYIPATLSHAAKSVTINITAELCELLSCNPMKEQDTCKPNEEASYYHVGDDGIDVQCQPACYNIAAKVSYNEDGKRAADITQLNWNSMQNECRIVNSNLTMWLEKTFYRSTTKFELRNNDMPTGFSRIPSDNPYGCGYTYKTNKTYCRYYDKTLQDDGSCNMTLLEKFLDATIGTTILNYIKSGIRMATNHGIPFELPENLPELPKELKLLHTIKGWRENINKLFVLPDLIDTKPKLDTLVSMNINNAKLNITSKSATPTAADDIHEYRRRAELNSMDNMSNFMRTSVGLDLDTSDEKIFGLDENGEILQPMGSSPSRTTRSVSDEQSNVDAETEDTPKHWTEKMKALFIGLLEMFTESDTYFYIGVDLVTTSILKKLKQLAAKIIEKMSAYLAKGLVDITGSIGIKVLLNGMKGLAIKIVATAALRIGAKIAIMFAKILAAAASVIGWILIGTMVLDLLFTFWDPLGYHNLFPPEIPRDMMDSGELSLRQALGSATASFKFDNLVALVLSEDEIMEIQIESLMDRVIYLDALVVNSEGSRIDKGLEINVNTGSKYDMDSAKNAGMAERVKFNLQNYEIYNDRFMSRVEVNKYLNYITASTVILSGVFLIAKMPLLSFVSIIIALITLAIARIELQDDILIDVLDKYRNKDPIYGGDYGYSKE